MNYEINLRPHEDGSVRMSFFNEKNELVLGKRVKNQAGARALCLRAGMPKTRRINWSMIIPGHSETVYIFEPRESFWSKYV